MAKGEKNDDSPFYDQMSALLYYPKTEQQDHYHR